MAGFKPEMSRVGNSRWVRQGVPLLAFACFVLLGWTLIARFDDETRRMDRVRTGEVAMTFALSVEKVLTSSLSATRTLAVLVYRGKGQVPDFTALARFLLPLYKGPMPCRWRPMPSSARSSRWTETCWYATTTSGSTRIAASC